MRKFILGTDWWTDCDDAVALRLLSRAVKAGEATLEGVVINACMEHSVASLRGFLRNEGLTSVPVGIDREATDFGGAPPYQKRLAETLAPDLTNAHAEDAVRLYRRILANATRPVELLEIGYLQAVAALLKSPADDISPQTGRELVAERVSRCWVMAGKWDADGARENNICRNPRARVAGQEFCALCPVPVTFLGFEVGYGVLTGGELPPDDVLHHVLCDHGSADGRHSWDPMLILLALVGDETAAGYTAVTGRAAVDPADGTNHFIPHPHGPHRYVVKAREDAFYAAAINARL